MAKPPSPRGLPRQTLIYRHVYTFGTTHRSFPTDKMLRHRHLPLRGRVVPYGISILFVRLIIVLGDDSTKGFPLRGSWRGTRLMRCSPSQRALSPLEFNGCSASYTSSVSHSLNTASPQTLIYRYIQIFTKKDDVVWTSSFVFDYQPLTSLSSRSSSVSLDSLESFSSPSRTGFILTSISTTRRASVCVTTTSTFL